VECGQVDGDEMTGTGKLKRRTAKSRRPTEIVIKLVMMYRQVSRIAEKTTQRTLVLQYCKSAVVA